MGQILVEVLSADIPGFLDALGTAGVIMEDLSFPDMLTIRFRIPGSAWKRIRSVAQSRGAAVQIVARRGLWWKIATLRRRPVLLAGVGLAIALALFLPTRVLTVEVQGNTSISANRIREAAARCGVSFGASCQSHGAQKHNSAKSTEQAIAFHGNTSFFDYCISKKEKCKHGIFQKDC